MGNDSNSWFDKLVMAATAFLPSNKELDWNVRTEKNTYYPTALITQGEFSTVYEGYFDQGESRTNVLIKLIRNPRSNAQAINEIKVLKHLFSTENPNQMHLPRLIDQFRIKDKRIGMILDRFDGFNLDEVRQNSLYTNGVPAYHVAWMIARLLAVTGFAHTMGVIHADIEPQHVLIRPHDHNLCLIGWSWALLDETVFKTVNKQYSAPEAAKGGEALTSADLFSIGKCAVYLLGGNLDDNTMPDSVDQRFQRFIKNMLLESPYQRARDAWETHKKLAELRVEIWGPEQFVVFDW